jgi:hypothetical protein
MGHSSHEVSCMIPMFPTDISITVEYAKRDMHPARGGNLQPPQWPLVSSFKWHLGPSTQIQLTYNF